MRPRLFQCNVVKEDRKTVDRTLLLNTNKVVNFYEDPTDSTKTVFHYDERGNRREKRIEFKYNGPLNAFKNLINEAAGFDTVSINVRAVDNHAITGWGNVGNCAYDRTTINLEYFVMAEDQTNVVGSWVKINIGAFQATVFDSTDTIDEIDTASSGSGSTSNS